MWDILVKKGLQKALKGKTDKPMEWFNDDLDEYDFQARKTDPVAPSFECEYHVVWEIHN